MTVTLVTAGEEVDEVAFELIQKVVSKKEKEMKSEAKFSVDISEDEVKSDAMLAEMRNELIICKITTETRSK